MSNYVYNVWMDIVIFLMDMLIFLLDIVILRHKILSLDILPNTNPHTFSSISLAEII